MKYSFRRVGSKLFEMFYNGPIALLPNRLFGGLRPSILRLLGARVGVDVKISRNVKVLGAKNLAIEDSVAVANSVVLDARGGLLLQEGTLIGFESVLLSYTHAWPDPDQPVHKQGIVSAAVSIGPNVWLGARTFVLPGSSVGASTVVGANSVVSGDIASMSIAVGNPAVVVSERRNRA